MLTELKSIFESVDKEILSEDTLKAISSLIEEKVNAKAEERIELEVENAVKAQYAKFKTVSEKAIASIDADHTNKIKMVLIIFLIVKPLVLPRKYLMLAKMKIILKECMII